MLVNCTDGNQLHFQYPEDVYGRQNIVPNLIHFQVALRESVPVCVRASAARVICAFVVHVFTIAASKLSWSIDNFTR